MIYRADVNYPGAIDTPILAPLPKEAIDRLITGVFAELIGPIGLAGRWAKTYRSAPLNRSGGCKSGY
ncbi:MAG: hypothetical protein ACLQJ0_19725 [Steroidobacteraceae bacterium]